MKRALVILPFLVAATVVPVAAQVSLDFDAYARCTTFATSGEPAPPEAEEVCLQPARQGLPGAEFALGAILLSHGKYPDAIQWLERAAKTGHPPAAHILAELYLKSQNSDLERRGRELLGFATCAGYPPAKDSESRAALGDLRCSPSQQEPFDGSWSAELDWIKKPPDGNGDARLKIVLSGDAVQVFVHSGESWVETKPGKFRANQVDDTLIVSATDSGWDLDGKWTEAWTVQLLRTTPQEADLVFLRTVNNIHVPEWTGFRTFTTVAQGRATRKSP